MNAIIETINWAGRAFVEFALPMFIQSSVLILILLALDVLLRRRVRAVFRYWIWMLVLVKLVLPPSLWSPVSIGTWLGETLEPPTASLQESPAPEPPKWTGNGMLFSGPTMGDFPAAMEPLEGRVPIAAPAQAVGRASPHDKASEDARPTLIWQGLVLLAWAAIVLALLLLLLQRAWFVRALVAQAQKSPPELTAALNQCRTRMGKSRPVAVRLSPNATSPAVCGLMRPVILIPQSLAPRLQPHDLDAVLLHELAHVKRGDLWVNLIQTLLQIVYFYNPLLWLANAMIRRVREQAVDEAVLVAMGETAPDYPETLLHIAKLAFHRRPALSLRLIGVVESRSALRSRIQHILTRPFPKTARLGIVGLVAILLTAAVLLPMAKGQRTQDQAGEPHFALLPDCGVWLSDIDGQDLPVLDLGSESIITLPKVESDFRLLQTTTSRGEGDVLYYYDRAKGLPRITFLRGAAFGDASASDKAETRTVIPPELPWQATLTTAEKARYEIRITRADEHGCAIYFRPVKNASDLPKAILPEGITVELVGLSEHPSAGRNWWRPDGSPLDEAPQQKVDRNVHPSSSETAYEFAVRLHDLPDGAAVTMKTDPGGSRSNGTGLNGLHWLATALPNDLQRCQVLVGIAAGAWDMVARTEGETSHALGTELGGVMFTQASEHPEDGVVITVTDDIVERLCRVVAVTKDARTVVASRTRMGMAGNARQTTAYFKKIAVDEIAEFQFQTRPWTWVEFKNVSLRAGYRAEVEVTGGAPDAEIDGSTAGAKSVSDQRADAEIWRDIGEAVPADANDARTLGSGVVLDGIGQDVEGKVFVACVRDAAATGDMQYRFVLHRKDGQVLEPRYYLRLDRAGGTVWEKFTFDMWYDHRSIDGFRLQVRQPDGDKRLGIPSAYDEIVAAAGAKERPSLSKQGPPGRYALSFDGRGDYLFIPDSESLRAPEQLTIELWIQPQFPDGSLANRPGWAVLAKGAYTGRGRVRHQGFAIRMDRADRTSKTVTFDHCVTNLDGRGYNVAGTRQRFSQDWIHVARTFHRNAFIPAPGHPLVVGRFLIPSEDPLMGQIAEIRIWDSAKSDYLGQYKDKALTGDEPGLVACWTFEEGSGQIAHDISSHANHARLGSSVTPDDADPTWLDLRAPETATKEISGRVLDPNGAPAAGAPVAWIDADWSVTIRDGRLMAPRFGDRGKGPIVETDERGSFRFDEEPNDGFSLLAAHEAGFALVGSEQFAKDRVIRLQRWGRIEGQVAQGREPLAGKIWMGGLPNSTWYEHRRDLNYEAISDSEGRFTFDRVPSGWFEVGYLTRMGDSVSSHTSRTPIVVEAGQTATMTLGGEGQPVIGRFVPQPDWEGPIYFGAGFRALDTARPDPPRPTDYDQMTQRRQQEWLKQWYKTPEAKKHRDAVWHDLDQRHYTFRIRDDGTFRIEDVIPGKYNFTVWLEERLSGGRPEEFGGYSGTIEVPPMDEAYSDESLDVGDLVLRLRTPLHTGDMAPSFEAETIDGKAIRLADCRGRFVLLNIWSPVFNPELDRLKELHAAYSPTGQLQIIGLGGTDTLDEVRKYVEEHDIEWPEIYFGPDWGAELLRQLGGQMQILLIDPDGKIVATWLRGEKLTNTVREAIGNAQLGVSGRILDPNGIPAPGAQVALCTVEKGIAVAGGRLGSYRLGSQHANVRQADGDGRFTLEERAEDFELVVASDGGFARLTDEQFAASPVIRLQPWGRIEGTVHIGPKPGANRLVQLQDSLGTEIGNRISYKDWSQADEDGHFVFEKVPPRWAEIGYRGGTRSRSSRWTNGRSIHILPGETAHVAIGATGRPVVGTLVVPPEYEMPTDLHTVVLGLRTVAPKMPLPEDYANMTQDQQYELRQQWLSTPEGQDYFVSVRHNPDRRSYATVLETDNTFRFEDVIAGRYELTVAFHLKPPRHLIDFPRGTAVEVPAVTEAYSDEPFDLGELILDTTETYTIP